MQLITVVLGFKAGDTQGFWEGVLYGRVCAPSTHHPIIFIGYIYPGLKSWAMDEQFLWDCLCVLFIRILEYRADVNTK